MLALELANTVATGRSPDELGDPLRAARWLVGRPAGRTAPGLATSLAWARRLQIEALRLREDVRTLLDAVARDADAPAWEAEGDAGTVAQEAGPGALALSAIERALAQGRWIRRLERSGPGLRLVEAPAPTATPLAILAPYAASAVELVATVRPERLRRCAADDCGRWFADISRGGRRRWCSMATCGNRRKAARHRERRHATP